MSVEELIKTIKSHPETVEFQQVMEVISACYEYSPTEFRNGDVVNAAGTNEGSCKIFAFAQQNGLSEQETLACFGHFYRDEVLGDPEGTGHGNIRAFMVSGWAGVQFQGQPLQTIN